MDEAWVIVVRLGIPVVILFGIGYLLQRSGGREVTPPADRDSRSVAAPRTEGKA